MTLLPNVPWLGFASDRRDQEDQSNDYEFATADIEQEECCRHGANLNKSPVALRATAPFKYQFSYFSFDASNITGVAMNNEL